MKLIEALKIGRNLGIDDEVSSINNVIFHSQSLFPLESVEIEIQELRKEAECIGIKFCSCGFALHKDQGCRFCSEEI